jgi:dihydroorotase
VGLESALPVGLSLVQQGKLPLARLIEALSTAPAKIAAVPGGSLKAGTPADFNITDLNQEFELTSDILHSRSHNTPHLGTRFRGRVLATFVGGKAKWLL